MKLSSRQTMLLIVLFIGILLITIDITKSYHEVTNQKIVYRYIPRNFNQNMDNPVQVTEIFEKMFTQPSPWIAGINTGPSRKVDKINKFFLSQV